MNPYTILIIDDEPQMRRLIRTFLTRDGYSVEEATDGLDALSKINMQQPHLCIVDVMMPYMDGFKFAKELKQTANIPLIFLSAKGEEWDKIEGLKLGGDDYIVKPFMPGELLARVESVLRRSYQNTPMRQALVIGPLVIDSDAHTVTLDNKPLPLTLKEFGVLETLAKNKGRVYSREQLLELVWGNNHHSTDRTVDTHIKTLRLKMGEAGSMIETVWGIGYKFEAK
ncbi:response regulator transcription factor [Sporosarcina thermotolerans]|uniref:Response regulator transcription factor n=1 Tax=Sporosarcina thermotolerans TaxID=633404 RepID=A0AAW9ABR4_9BACL|nr:response regulator transcription factor [Sporosarcina thermotolerans]MDW0117088.1 response regulator transcription factor [Sporosarcina thermotolerans]WHT47818.1 response regulator transcription factor [Sporosarcina thermotolerans]